MTLPSFTFPLLRIAPQVGPWAGPGREVVEDVSEDGIFHKSDAWDLKHHRLDGSLLIDSERRCWKIVEVQDLGVERTVWEKIFLWLPPHHRIACKFVELESMSLDAIKERVCTAIASNPDAWRDDEAIAGEDGPPRDEQEMLDELQTKVREAQSVPEIISALHTD
jgi:hypothetical protein